VIVEEAKEIIEKTEIDFELKSRIPRGLSVLMQFSDDIECSCEHDQIWCADFEATVAKMGEGAVEMMAKLGWFEDEEAWSHFT